MQPPTPAEPKPRTIRAPMPGRVVEVFGASGDALSKGAVVITLEAMKMQNEIRSPAEGTLADIHVASGQNIKKGAPLFSILPGATKQP